MEKEGQIKHFQNIYCVSMLITVVAGFAAILVIVMNLFEVGKFFYSIFSSSCVILNSYYIISSSIYFKTLKKAPQNVARYYMIHMLVRFVVCGIIAVAGGLILKEDVKVFLLSFCIFFVLTLVCESFVFVYFEKKLNEKQIDK